MQYIITTYKELPMSITNCNMYKINRTFEGILVTTVAINKITQHLNKINDIISYSEITNEDFLNEVNDMLNTITSYGYGDAVDIAIKRIIKDSLEGDRRDHDISFMIDVIVHTLIISPANNVDYRVINFDFLAPQSGITKHYDNPLVSRLFEYIPKLPTYIYVAIIEGLGDFIDNVYCKYRYQSVDIPKSGNIVTHIDYNSLTDETTSVIVHNREVCVDINQTITRMRNHDLGVNSDGSINGYIYAWVTRNTQTT